MEIGDVASDLRQALEGVAGLPCGDVGSISTLIDAGELQIALETLCTQVYECDIEIGDGQRRLLRQLGTRLCVPVDYLLGDPWAPTPEPGP